MVQGAGQRTPTNSPLDRATLAGMENFQINLGQRITALRRRLGLKANDVVTVDLNSLGTSPNTKTHTHQAQTAPQTAPKKPVSAAARKRMAAAQEERWAKIRALSAGAGGAGTGQGGGGTAKRKPAGHAKKSRVAA